MAVVAKEICPMCPADDMADVHPADDRTALQTSLGEWHVARAGGQQQLDALMLGDDMVVQCFWMLVVAAVQHFVMLAAILGG